MAKKIVTLQYPNIYKIAFKFFSDEDIISIGRGKAKMEPSHKYIIQCQNGVEKVNFNRLFNVCHFGVGVEKLLAQIWHYINYYDDVSDEQSIKISEIISVNMKSVRVDKFKLIRNNKVDELYFQDVVDSILDYKDSLGTEEMVFVDYSGFYYIIFDMSEKEVITKIKNHINEIDSRFFERSGEKKPNLISRMKFKVGRILHVC